LLTVLWLAEPPEVQDFCGRRSQPLIILWKNSENSETAGRSYCRRTQSRCQVSISG
jgi:hypothetical protein